MFKTRTELRSHLESIRRELEPIVVESLESKNIDMELTQTFDILNKITKGSYIKWED